MDFGHKEPDRRGIPSVCSSSLGGDPIKSLFCGRVFDGGLQTLACTHNGKTLKEPPRSHRILIAAKNLDMKPMNHLMGQEPRPRIWLSSVFWTKPVVFF